MPSIFLSVDIEEKQLSKAIEEINIYMMVRGRFIKDKVTARFKNEENNSQTLVYEGLVSERDGFLEWWNDFQKISHAKRLEEANKWLDKKAYSDETHCLLPLVSFKTYREWDTEDLYYTDLVKKWNKDMKTRKKEIDAFEKATLEQVRAAYITDLSISEILSIYQEDVNSD